MISERVKKALRKSLQDRFQGIDFDKLINIFSDILCYDTNEKSLDDIQDQWEQALTVYFDDESSFSSVKVYSSTFFNIEPLLKKVLYIVDRDTFHKFLSENKGLMPVMQQLKISPSYTINGNNFTSSFHRELELTYRLRNATAHEANKYNRDVFYTGVNAILITLFCSIHLNRTALTKSLSSANLSTFRQYLTTIVNSFKEKSKLHINLDGSEDVKSINTVVIEDITSIDNLDEYTTHEPREGEINELRTKKIPEKRMMIIGEAGLGKTTTLEYLAYTDAQEILRNGIGKIPVILYLNIMVDVNVTIMDYIAKALSIDVNRCIDLLSEGILNLFIDGLNEIPNVNELRNLRIAEINGLLSRFPNTFIIITTRPQTSELIHQIPHFNLLSLDDNKQNLFIDKNCSDPSLQTKILASINQNEKIRRVVRTPLFLSIYIRVVAATGEIPKSEGDLIRMFLNSIFEREIREKRNYNFDIKKAYYLLRGFAYDVKEKYKSNSGVIESEIIDCFSKRMKQYSFIVDAIDYLTIFLDLGIIVEKDSLFCFYHEAYQDYFYSNELRFLLGI